MSVASLITDFFKANSPELPQASFEDMGTVWAELRTAMLTRHAKLFKSDEPSQEALVTALTYQGYISQDEADFLHDVIDGQLTDKAPEFVVAELRSIADKALTEMRHLN